MRFCVNCWSNCVLDKRCGFARVGSKARRDNLQINDWWWSSSMRLESCLQCPWKGPSSYIHTYIHTYIHACMHACMDTYIHTYIHRTSELLEQMVLSCFSSLLFLACLHCKFQVLPQPSVAPTLPTPPILHEEEQQRPSMLCSGCMLGVRYYTKNIRRIICKSQKRKRRGSTLSNVCMPLSIWLWNITFILP